jgi:hypothetical protein
MKRSITRERGARYCTVTIELQNGRLSITGHEGRVATLANAKREAVRYWTNYFEEERGAIQEINERCSTRFTSAAGAAKYVLRSDGELHGLDATVAGKLVHLLESCGQITETVADYFPEVRPLLPWHLNDMKAGCEHQEALGWGSDSIGTPCPECGYKYGSKWLRRELPGDVQQLAERIIDGNGLRP